MAVSFKGAHFPKEVILMGVRWYVAYPLSTRHVEELMEERGVEVDHSTINRWVIKYSPQADWKFSATRLCWSKGIGGGDAFMKLCVSSSGRETRPAKGEPAQAGSGPCADSVVSLQRAGKYQRPVW